MVARLSIYSNVDLDLADRLKAWIEGDGAGVFDRLPGYHGSMTLVDRENARVVGIGFYESPGHLTESEAVLAEIYAEGREQAAQLSARLEVELAVDAAEVHLDGLGRHE